MIKETATKMFGNTIYPYLDSFEPLEIKLRYSQIRMSLEEYLSLAFFACMMAFIATMLVGVVFAALATTSVVFSYTLAIVLSFVSTGATFVLFYWYPSLRSKNIESKIGHDLPFALASMAATASSGMHPVDIFKMLSMRKGIIGQEGNKIYRDVKMLGMDISTALSKAANRTPSLSLSEVLWGMVSSITTGTSLKDYLDDKTKESMSEYRRMLSSYSTQINFYTEIYITLIIVGTLFFIVLSSIMSPLIGADILLLQTFIVFIFVPMVSAGFIVLLKGLSPQNR